MYLLKNIKETQLHSQGKPVHWTNGPTDGQMDVMGTTIAFSQISWELENRILLVPKCPSRIHWIQSPMA